MNPDKLRERTEKLLRKSRVFEKPSRRAENPSLLRASIAVAFLGIIAFCLLFFVISSLFGDTTESIGSKRFFLGFLLVVFQLFPTVTLAISFFAESRRVYGTWISTKRTLFHKKSDHDYAAIDWDDVQVVERIGPNIVFRGRHRQITVPTGGDSGNPSRSISYLWFLNRLIEDYGPNRPGAEPLHELRRIIICPFLYPFVRKSATTWFFLILIGILFVLLTLSGIPLFHAQLEAGRDPRQLILALQIWALAVAFWPFLLLVPLIGRHPSVRKKAFEIYENEILPQLKQPLQRVSVSDFEKWQFGRKRHPFSRFQADEKLEQFLATIPPPPRTISESARRRFMISGEVVFFTPFVAGLISLCAGIFLIQGTEHSIREAQFWNWTPAGTGTIVRIEPEYKRRDGRTAHVYDRLEYTHKNTGGTETWHLDTRGFEKGTFKVGQTMAVQVFRGDERFLRLESKSWKDQADSSVLVILLIPALTIFSLLVIVLWMSSVTEGPKKIRFWETAETGWGKVVGSTLKGTTVRLVKPEGDNQTIYCPGVVYLGRENLWRPLAVFLDPENPAEGTTIRPLPFGLRIDPETGELTIDPKMRWFWPSVAGLVLLAFVLLFFATVKFFAV